MAGCNPVSTPLVVNEKLRKEDGGKMVDETHFRSFVGNLLYFTATRPDIMFAASLLSRFMHYPSHLHLGAAKDDWDGCIDDMKSTSGYAFSLGSGAISWVSKKQGLVAQSSAEAEYISASLATSQAIWLRRILEDIKEKQNEATYLLCDNKSAIAIAKNYVFHIRTRHIAVKYHFIKETISNGEVQLMYCKSEEQVADIFTKALPLEKLVHFRKLLGLEKHHIRGENVT
ncbi:Retrovirus-related Pol polyprotein from transposon RE1 [Vitis vinifera]|uniref:Retrovirus-related Pol polyprotein from transposon RE1 n=1 Tax=Vitis vinifera TaxID=29760 RepID=A0A438H7A8_VITVI|nr:Retrovirus-related Pol polyprotein from transposon RE1 [Vitis vinifera]